MEEAMASTKKATNSPTIDIQSPSTQITDLMRYESSMQEVTTMSDSAIERNSTPIDKLLFQSDKMHVALIDNKDTFATKNFPMEEIAHFERRIGACRIAQSNYSILAKGDEANKIVWAQKHEEAIVLKSNINKHVRFVCTEFQLPTTAIKKISEGTGIADLIQDLSDLATLGQNIREHLEKINFNLALLDRAAKLASELGKLQELSQHDRSQTKIIRDKLVTLLNHSVSKVRRWAHLVFEDDSPELPRFYATYSRKKVVKKDDTEQVEYSDVDHMHETEEEDNSTVA